MRVTMFTAALLLWSQTVESSPKDRQFAGPRVRQVGLDGLSRIINSKLKDYDLDGNLHTYRVRADSQTHGKGKNRKSITHYFFEYVVSGKRTTLIGRWNSKQDDPRTYTPLGVRVSKEGRAYAVVSVRSGSGVNRRTDVMWYRSARSLRTLEEGESWGPGILLLGQDDSPVFFWESFFSIYVHADGKTKELVESSMYDWSAARLSNGEVYLFAHNYRDRSLVVRMAQDGQWTWKDEYVDMEESGWQHSVSATDTAVYVAYYFYRNSFNKGLKLAQLSGLEIVANETYHREKNFNAGWEPSLAISKQNNVVISFLEDVQAKKTKTDTYSSVDALMAFAKNNEHSYVDGWEDSYRDWFVLLGPEAAFQFWSVLAPTPSLEDAPKQFDAQYDYNPSLVASGMFEARWGSTNLGISYTQGLIADAIEDGLGTNAKRVFNFVGGFLGFDKLFMGQDVRVTVGLGKFQGAYTDQDGTVATPTDLYNFELGLLNQYRMRFGLAFRQYSLRQPVYAYYAAAQQVEYSFSGSAVVDADIYRLEAFVGYSKLDYLSKYENYYSGLDLESKLGGGLSLMTWDKVDLGQQSSSGTLEVALSGQLRLVYLYFKRFYSLHGAGVYFRAGYGVEIFANGFTSGKPEDRDPDEDEEDDDLDSDSFVTSATHYQIQHGPFLGFGLVY